MSLFYVFIGLVVLVTASADNPLWISEIEESIDIPDGTYSRSTDTVYRLPQNVVPLEYDIYIDLYFAEATDRPFSFDGRENIIIQVLFVLFSVAVFHFVKHKITKTTQTN